MTRWSTWGRREWYCSAGEVLNSDSRTSDLMNVVSGVSHFRSGENVLRRVGHNRSSVIWPFGVYRTCRPGAVRDRYGAIVSYCCSDAQRTCNSCELTSNCWISSGSSSRLYFNCSSRAALSSGMNTLSSVILTEAGSKSEFSASINVDLRLMLPVLMM